MPQGFTPEPKRILRENGCWFVRAGKGDHEIWEGPITKRRFVVDSKILSRTTADVVLKQAGITKAF